MIRCFLCDDGREVKNVECSRELVAMGYFLKKRQIKAVFISVIGVGSIFLLTSTFIPHLLATFALSNVTATHALLSDPEKVAVPSYFYPGPLWTQMESGASTVGLVIINPNSGPGTGKDQSYADQVTHTEAKGIIVVGYISTSYAGMHNVARTLAAAERDADTYYRWYPNIEGIFVDEVSTDCSSQNSYYQPLYNCIKKKGGRAEVVLNPGMSTAECYMKAGDIIVNFEGVYSHYVNWTPANWVSKYSANRFWHIIYSTSRANMPQAVALSKKRNAGWVYITDDGGDNPYDTLASYWSNELSLVSHS